MWGAWIVLPWKDQIPLALRGTEYVLMHGAGSMKLIHFLRIPIIARAKIYELQCKR